MILSQSEEVNLNKIKNAIEGNESLDTVLSISKQLESETALDRFSYMYAGILLARHNRVEDALRVLDFSKSNYVIFMIIEFLKEHSSIRPSSTLFQDPAIYDIHNQTKFYKMFFPNTVSAISLFAKENPPINGCLPTILDIGPGNGYLLAAIINSISHEMCFDKLRLILVEPSQNMLSRCIDYCRQKIKIPLEIETINSKVECLSEKEMSAIFNSRPIWFINASASLHHMPSHLKKKIFHTLKRFSKWILLSEFEAYIDKPERDTPQLVYSVINFVNFSFQSVLNDPEIEKERGLLLLKQYYLIEVLNMLTKTRPERGDYQATYDEWKEYVENSGGFVFRRNDTSIINNMTHTFTMEIHY